MLADNGVVGIASQYGHTISIDGNLDDWPDGVQEQRIEHCRDGTFDSGDFDSSFRAVWNDVNGVLFLAIEIQDDVLNRFDQGQLFLDVRHDRGQERVLRFFFPEEATGIVNAKDPGSEFSGPDVKVAAVVDEAANRKVYEWRIPLSETPGFTRHGVYSPVIGLGMEFRDHDGPEGRQFFSWGRSKKHHDLKACLGDLILAEQDMLTGTLKFELPDLPHPDLSPLLDLYLNGSPDSHTAYLTLEASVEHTVPVGEHSLAPLWDAHETPGRKVRISPDRRTTTSLSLGVEEPLVSKISWNVTPLIAPPPINRDEFYSYGVIQGFLSTPGTGIAEDARGGIWISGLSGITYMSNNRVQSFPWRPVAGSDGYRGIAIDKSTGLVCIAEESRISFIRNGNELIEYGPGQGVALAWTRKSSPIPIVVDKNRGGFWIGQDEGLLRVTPDLSFSMEAIARGRLSNLVLEEDGTLWAGTTEGLFKRNGENDFQQIPVDLTGQEEGISALALDPAGHLWLGTGGAPDSLDGKLLRIDKDSLEVVEVEPDGLPPFRKITHLNCEVDSSGRKLLHAGISESHWYYRFLIEEPASGSISLRPLGNAHEAGSIRDTLLDRYGIFWLVGTDRVLASSPVQPYDPFFPPDLTSKHTVQDFILDRGTGALWCATSKGVVVTSPTPRLFGKEDGLPVDMVNTILEDSAGTVWVGTKRGIAVLEGDRFRELAGNGSGIRDVHCLMEGRDGSIWAGAATGLVRIDKDGKREVYLRKHPITSLISCDDGSVLVVENRRDIFRLRNEELEKVSGYEAKLITCLAKDTEGRIWVGGEGAAPAVFDGEKFAAPPSPMLGPPVSAFSVDSIAFGTRGNRWMGHQDGIFVTDGQVWQQAFGFRDRAARVTKILFSSENEAFLLAGGTVFRYEINSTPPSVSHSSAKVPDEESPKTISDLNTSDGLRVNFTSQTSRALPGHMAYRYKVDDNPWKYTRSQSISVPTPNVGTHKIEIEAIDPDLKHSAPLVIPIRIRPDHSSFLITLALFVAGVIGFLQVVRLIRNRGEKERKQRELEETVSRRTAQIAAANEELKKRQAVSRVLSKISTRFISLPPASIGEEISKELGRVARAIEAQRAHIYLAKQNMDPVDPDFHVDLAYQWHDEEVGPMSEQMHRIYPHRFPWVEERYFRGEPSIVLNPDELPDYAVPEKALFEKMKWTSIGIVPMFVENQLVGSFGFSTYANPLSWSAVLVDELKIAGEIFANALERMNQSNALHELRQDALDAEERERTRISRELHDQLGGALTGLKMHSRSLQKQLLDGQASPDQIERAQRISEIIDDTLPDVRRICAELRPAILDDLDLPEALKWQVDQFEKHTNIPCELDISHNDFPEQEMNRDVAIYRITQELLTNVIRHSKADRVSISLKRMDDDLLLRVSDNGKGIDTLELAKMTGRFGLRGIRERAEHLGGSISIVDPGGKGCTVEAKIPVDPAPLKVNGILPVRLDRHSI